jgi:hypothetical protein
MMDYTPIAAAGVSVAASGIGALLVWGVKGEIKTLRTELRAGLAEAENRFFQRINGSYTRKDLHADLVARVDRIETKVDELE